MRISALSALLALLSFTAGAAAEISVTVRTAKGEAVADAVVSLLPLDAPAPAPAAEAAAEIAQQNQEYTTYVTVVQTGTRVVFPNRDNVQHHVYSLSKAKKFELPLYNPGSAASILFDVSGVVALGCNIHDWMLAYLVVVPTPFFAKTGAAGAARITAPAGRYRLELWHPRLAAALTQEIALPADAAAAQEFTLTLKPDRRIRRGPDSKSGIYH